MLRLTTSRKINSHKINILLNFTYLDLLGKFFLILILGLKVFNILELRMHLSGRVLAYCV